MDTWEPPVVMTDGYLQVGMGYTIDVDDDNPSLNTVTVGVQFGVIAGGTLNVNVVLTGIELAWPVNSQYYLDGGATATLLAHKGPV